MLNINFSPQCQYRATLRIGMHYESSLIRRVEQTCIEIIRDIYNFLREFFYECAEILNLAREEVEIDLREPQDFTVSQLASPILYGITDLLEVNNKINSKERSFFINFSQTSIALYSVFDREIRPFNDFRSIAKTAGILAFSMLSSNARLYKEFKIFNAGMALLETSINLKNTFELIKKSWNISKDKPLNALRFSLVCIANLGVSCFRAHEAISNPYFINDTKTTQP